MCEVCNDPGHEDKLMICDACDSGYHTFCLSPPLNRPPLGKTFFIHQSIPCVFKVMENIIGGWRCQECVKCLHCGSKTPGTGASCKWRANYTACDSCYQLYLDGKVPHYQTINVCHFRSVCLIVFLFASSVLCARECIDSLTRLLWWSVRDALGGCTSNVMASMMKLINKWLKVSP